jgi:predicted CxxxxCH...CXXCH cytochrome family protein
MLTTRSAIAVVLLAGGLACLSACGKAAPGATNFDPATGKHTPADWATNHGSAYARYQKQCQNCHGADLKGGTSGMACDKCHGLPHGAQYPAHANADTNLCKSCHGTNFQGGITAPACNRCHTQLAPAAVPVPGACASCHTYNNSAGDHTGPSGAIYPNRSGAHLRHFANSHNGFSCPACHLGGGSGTANHGTSLTVAFPTNLSMPGAAATYDSTSKRCANVSCHGGITTPGWGVDHFVTAAGCGNCHASGKGVAHPAFNSYSSGAHSKHVGLMLCSACHDTAILNAGIGGATHFSNMTSSAFNLSPAATLKSTLNYATVPGSCTITDPALYGGIACHGTGNRWRE